MKSSPILLFHICAATIGLISGSLSMVLGKGSGAHRVAGNVYFVSMVGMSVSAAYIATFMHPIMLNVVVGLLTFYLVTTGWWAARRPDGRTSAFDYGALLFVLAVGVSGITFGFQAVSSPTGTKNGMPAAIYFVFGSIALLFAVADVRMTRRGGVSGPRRIARHLWRMSFALLIAWMSFYPGQAKLFPKELRDTNVLFLPHLFLIGAIVFSLVRVARRKRVRQNQVVATMHRDAVAERVA